MSETSYPDALPAQYRLHWYVLERVLGQGGFGITYLARDTNLDQPVAIKEYLPVDVATRRPDASVRSRTEELSERYRWGLERFIREARTLAKFDHPAIVRVHSVFEINDTAYMVMRFEKGESLAALLERRRTLPESDLLRIVLPILDGLELVHNAGFIHRDIKPDNIYIRDDGSPVLLDFGSARHALGHARTVTILVAPGYAPFEQYYSTGENQGPWTDLYSLGATCYRAIAGIEPMDAIARSKGILGSTREILVPAAMIGSARYSPGLLQAVDHALEFAEKDRPQSIAEWRSALKSGSAPAPEPVRLAAPMPAATPASAPASAGSVRGPVIWATLGAVVAAAIAAGVMLWPRPVPTPVVDDQAQPQEEERRKKEALDAAAKQEAAAALKKQQEAEAAQKERDRIAAEEKQRRLDEAARKEQERQIALLQLEYKRLREQRLKDEAALKQREQKLANDKLKLEERQQELARIEADRRRQQEAARAKEATLKEQEKKLAKPAPQPAPEPVPPKPAPGAELLALAQKAQARGDDAERLQLLRKAGRLGNPQALFELGDAFATGRGVAPNSFEAYIWFRRAQYADHKDAAARLEQLRTKLQPAEVEHAERAAARLAQE
jgi:serine/threonine protein kinase/TPR repeat protein